MGEFRMPSLGADMDAGTVSKWLVRPGDEVHRGDIVAVVDTEKSTIDVEIFENGRMAEILVPEGERVPVGTVLARVEVGAEAPAVPAAAEAPPVSHAPPSKGAGPGRRRIVPSPGHPGVVLSPVVRHLAETLGVDTSHLAGTGPGGRVTRADVEHAVGAGRGAPSPAAPAASTTRAVAGGGRPRISPLARRLAAELGVDLSTVSAGSGPDGAVVEADVRRVAAAVEPAGEEKVAAERPAPAPETTATEPPVISKQAAMRHAIGVLMARSKREIPHYYLATTIDMQRAATWLEQANLERPLAGRLVMPVLLLKATAVAVAVVPEMNGLMVDGVFQPSGSVHVGVATSIRGGGVIAPAIHDVERLSLDELMAALHDLVNRARHGSLRSSEMSDPTITVSNLGDLGVESVFGVIYPPQVALVGFGRVHERPWAANGMVGARLAVTATLSADHRVSDGHRGGLFLSTIDKLLQEPEEL
jgi:pyruvate dehydrogenase E2 component (dihydrolipoamide acetyltransferase)